ncbi:Uncharacterised protein [Mycobacterium tuberculosis]|uniref:Uncharacterized protein n=1 Tax=Mycobacterium tuberculosis TaxID=1773 RepID=A0A0T9DSP9_MYCTX|nr:Uncharacterised protein [Mycobacterium tuberculosis]CFR71862.1 Uncharacterised protein [Mycobacterium tuberculosis]CKR98634.1 Uncharacterised protein [Mycobacterium tuberculosis]CKS57316.1 Uncharacterised protein [Mycobacterium tuberculosis]CKS90460.1 Uncharacterised protein [Mycobacterium tuberculosis]
MHTGRVDQPGASETFPTEERHRGNESADQQRSPVVRQYVFAVGIGVVQPDDGEAQRECQQQTTDQVDSLGLRAAVV